MFRRLYSDVITNMGISDYSHGKKVDKETQSPLLKIFKDIMTREKDDPEKRNLLTEQKEDKKRRQYSVSRTKIDRRSCDSSGSEHRKRGGPYKSSTDQRIDFNQTRPQSMPYQSEKKDSWWFWKDDPKKPTEDTCSCVSCALKRIVSSEYACIGCLILLFTISVIVAFLVVFKSVPGIAGGDNPECHSTTTEAPEKQKCSDSERLKRKIEMLNENRLKNGLTGVDEFRKNDKKRYNDALPGNLGVSSQIGIDFGPSFRELHSLQESDNKPSEDWTNLLEADKADLQSSEKLREFYKKLVQTDAQIKSLKKINQIAGYSGSEDSALKSPERSKRSLKLYSYPKRYHVVKRRKIFNKDHKTNEPTFMKRRNNRTRNKRFSSNCDEPTGFVIEKKKIIVQYRPSDVRKKVAVKKCSHAPKDSHTHENQLKHPFYQNTQRLDELLDRFLNKNLPEMMSDPFGLDSLFKHDKNAKCKHHKPNKNVDIMPKDALIDQIPKPKSKKIKEEKNNIESRPSVEVMKMMKPESSTQYEKDFYHHEVQMIGKEKPKVLTSSPHDFEVLLSVSTIMNPDVKKSGSNLPSPPYLMDPVPKLRRLMQLEMEDEDNLGYEDFKEVLTDETENHDELDKRTDRKKRRDEETWPSEKIPKFNPPGVHNPNWKGPMPLYPDELNSMIRHAVLNANGVELPKSTNDLQQDFLERKGRDLSDVEYVEDYVEDKDDQLVEMAQAYSDYGVLDGKKDSRNDKNSASDVTVPDHRIKLSIDENFHRAGLLDRLKEEQNVGDFNTMYTKSQTSEGIRFELRPPGKADKEREKDTRKGAEQKVLKLLEKHIKLKPDSLEPNQLLQQSTIKPSSIHSTPISTYPDVELIYSTKSDFKPKLGKTEPNKTKTKTQHEIDSENGLIFTLNKGKRSLLSTDFKRTANFRADEDISGDWRTSTTRNRSNIEKFVQNLNLRRHNLTHDRALVRYIERVKQKNIRVFSTAHPYFSKMLTTTTFTERTDEIPSVLSHFKVLNIKNKPVLNDTIITINRSEIGMNELTGNDFFGKIFLTVQNPDIGEQNIDIKFDVPLDINWRNELLLMSDDIKYPNLYNQFEIFTESSIEQNDQNERNETEIELKLGPSPDEGTSDNKTIGRRHKRDFSTFDNPNTSIETINNTPVNLTSNSSINFNVSANHRSTNLSESDNMTMSDFFMMVSDWFKALDGAKVDKPRENSGSDLTEMLLKINTSNENKNTTDIVYPLYDADMIENIGHRSRVLLSVENLGNSTDEKSETEDRNVTRAKEIESTGGNVSNVTNSSTPVSNLKTNITMANKDTNKEIDVPKRDNEIKSKAVFKRNADDSNLIFWNDIYDDEYGIQTDKFYNSIRDKHSVKDNDFIKRSGRWVHDKIKKFAENLKINPRIADVHINEREQSSMDDVQSTIGTDSRYISDVHSMAGVQKSVNPKSVTIPMDDVPKSNGRVPRFVRRLSRSVDRVPGSVRKSRFSTYPKFLYNRIYDRFSRRDTKSAEEEDYDMDQKSIFTALSSNMKDICKKAARAVEQTRNIEVKEDSKEGSIAATLMQQLVRLLTDLVDYQVQQKTCTQLPPDLERFLEWLTYPKEDTADQQSDAVGLTYPEEDLTDELEFQNVEDITSDPAEEPATTPPNNKLETSDLKLQYITCLRSVQELLDQYEDMTDDEKSKMTGVRNYLENQIRSLNRQLASFELLAFFKKQRQLRFKRDLSKKFHQKPFKNRIRRRLHKFIKNFGKKHTRTTASFYDAVQVTGMKRNIAAEDEIEVKNENDFEGKDSNEVKRNLKDVYYKAIAEAKKYATGKNGHKKHDMTHFLSTTAKEKQ